MKVLRFDESNMNTLNLEQRFLCGFKMFLLVSKLFAMIFWSFDMNVACLIVLFD